MNGSNDILFVIVIYNCTLENSISFKTLIEPNNEENNLFVYDNSPVICETTISVSEYVHDTSNRGIGKAYNVACQHALKHGYKWLLLLDQDTTFPLDALTSYRKAIRTVPDVEMIVPRHKVSNGKYLSPTPYRMKTSDFRDTAPTGMARFSDVAPINSGILVSVNSFIRTGGYEEKVWLDMSDICFIEKYKRLYPTFYIMPDVICMQAFSSIETDKRKIYKRFCIYLECAHNYPCRTIWDYISLTITTLRPTLSRTIKEKTLKYLKVYWNVYVLGIKDYYKKENTL